MSLNKLLTVIAVPVLSCVCVSVYAAPDGSSGWYGGVSAGRSTNRFESSDFRSGVAGVSESSNEHDTAWKLYGGYKFNPTFGIEGGYTDLGKFNYNYLDGAGNAAQQNYKVDGFSLAGTATVPLGQGFSAFGKAGVFMSKASDSASGTAVGFNQLNGSHRVGTPLLGVGLQYDLDKTYALRAEYENFGRVGDQTGSGRANADLLSVGLNVKF
jgi:OOP family OmpA-OmpF porin